MSDAFDLHWKRGVDFYDAGNLTEAIAEWREALRLEPDHEDTSIILATALSETNQQQEALRVLRKTVKLSPNSAILRRHLGYHLADQGDQDNNKALWLEARQTLQKAVLLEAESAYALQLLGSIEWRLGQKRKAIEFLKASIAADPSNVEVYLALGECQRRAFHWRGMAQTVLAMNKLPASEELDRFYGRINRSSQRFWLFSGIVAATVVVLLWIKHRKAQE